MTYSLPSLRYRFLEGESDLSPLRILESRTVAWAGREVTFCILAASHAVRIEADDTCVTEVLACGPVHGASRIRADAPGDTPTTLCATAAGLIWQARLTVEPLAVGPGRGALGRNDSGAAEGSTPTLQHANTPADGRISAAYPWGEVGPAPVTTIGWTVEGRILRVETLHTYPESGVAVRTETTFTEEDCA